MKKAYVLIPALLATLLTACGGGGGGGESSNAAAATATGSETAAGTTTGTDTITSPGTTVAATGNTGSVSAPFVSATEARYMVLGRNSQQFGALSTFVQDATGAVTTINSNVLSGAAVIKDVAGDAGFTQGRWVAGTATTSSGATVLTGGSAYHYMTYNRLAALPMSGTASCDAGTFTAPMYVAGGSSSAAETATTTGNASIAFGSTGAVVTGMLTSIANAAMGSTSLDTTIATSGSTSTKGNFLSNGAGASIALGTDGGAGYLVTTGYSVTLANGARYTGVANFRCK